MLWYEQHPAAPIIVMTMSSCVGSNWLNGLVITTREVLASKSCSPVMRWMSACWEPLSIVTDPANRAEPTVVFSAAAATTNAGLASRIRSRTTTHKQRGGHDDDERAAGSSSEWS